MDKDKCKNKAECIYPWAGKLMKACKQHATAMKRISEAIGGPIEIKALPENNEPCMHMDDLE